MRYQRSANQYNRTSTGSFTRLLADYRARVYETYSLAISSPAAFFKKSANPLILVIEDNTDQWFLTRLALSQRFPKAQIQWLTDGKEVIPYLDACRQREDDLPQMILVDLYLPSAQQGLYVLKAIKSHPLYKSLPTFTLSQSNHVEDITQAFDNLADGYLVKQTGYNDWLEELRLLDRFWK